MMEIEQSKEYQLHQDKNMELVIDFLTAHGTKDLADVGGAGYQERFAIFDVYPDVYDLSPEELGDTGTIHDICAVPLPRQYETIICCNTYEHLIDPFSASQNLIKSLKKGGWLYVSTVWIYPFHAYRDVPDTYRYTDQCLSLLFKDLKQERCWYCPEAEIAPEGSIRVTYIGQKV